MTGTASIEFSTWPEANQLVSSPPAHLVAALLQVQQQHFLVGQLHPATTRRWWCCHQTAAKSKRLLSSLHRAEPTLMSSSCPYKTLRKSLISLQPLLYSSGTSKLRFNKAVTELEEKNHLIDNAAVQPLHKPISP